MSWNQSQNAFNSNRCDRDLCHKMTYITVAVACLISQLYPCTPLYLSGIDKIFRSKEVLYDLVAWKISKLQHSNLNVTRNACFDAIYIVNRGSVVTWQTLKAGSSVIFQPTMSCDTSLKRSHHYLNIKEVYKVIAVYLNPFRQWGK